MRSAAAGPSGLVTVPVLAILDETHDIRTFRIARPAEFDVRAGQSLAVSIRIEGRRLTRRFPISSAPESADHLEFTVKRGETLANALYATIGVGSLLAVGPPEGRFVYPEGDPRPLLLLAGGVGCAPLLAMLRHAAASDPSRSVTMLLSVRSVNDIPYRRELARLRQRHENLRVGVTLTREDRRPGLLAGRIDAGLLRRAAPDPANTLFYVCGPAPMLEEMKKLLFGLGVPASQIRWEAFDDEATSEPADGEETGPVFREPTTQPQVLIFSRKEQVRQILRFARGEMMLHWSIAVPFLICFVTGVTMKIFYNLHSDSLFREVLSFLHRVSGGCLAVFPALAIARNWRDYKVHIYNVKVGFSWTIDDLKWLFLVGPATVSKRIVLPEQRKFNAAERMNFMMVMLTYPLFIGTGAFLWWHGVDHFVPWIIHISLSLVAPLLMMGHIYMAVVNPSTRVGLSGMITGRVDKEWAKHHYKRWYHEHFEDDGTPKSPGPAGR